MRIKQTQKQIAKVSKAIILQKKSVAIAKKAADAAKVTTKVKKTEVKVDKEITVSASQKVKAAQKQVEIEEEVLRLKVGAKSVEEARSLLLGKHKIERDELNVQSKKQVGFLRHMLGLSGKLLKRFVKWTKIGKLFSKMGSKIADSFASKFPKITLFFIELKDRAKIAGAKIGKFFGKIFAMIATDYKKMLVVIGVGLKLYAAGLKKAFGLIKNGLSSLVSFMMGGMSFNPFSMITEGVNELIEAEDELKEKQEKLLEDYRAGRVSKEEFQKGVGFEEKSPEDVGTKLVDDMIDKAVSFVNKIVEMAPIVLKRLAEKLPILIKAIATNLPKLLNILATHIPPLIETVVTALAEAIPVILQTIMNLLPELLPQLLALFQQLVELIIENIPMFIKIATQLMVGIIKALPGLIQALINAMPDILQALVDSLDMLITALIDALPQIVSKLLGLIVKMLMSPEFWKVMFKLFIELGFVLVKGIAEGLYIFFRDVFKEMFSFGKKKTETFGDTPGPQYVPKTSSGMAANFAPGDYVVAAKEPAELLRQSLQAMGTQINKGANRPPSAPTSPEMISSGGAVSTNIAIVAEGRLLDLVQVTAMDRGHAPKMSKRLKKASGVKVGFDRGNYQKYALNK